MVKAHKETNKAEARLTLFTNPNTSFTPLSLAFLFLFLPLPIHSPPPML